MSFTGSCWQLAWMFWSPKTTSIYGVMPTFACVSMFPRCCQSHGVFTMDFQQDYNSARDSTLGRQLVTECLRQVDNHSLGQMLSAVSATLKLI